jgi:hypothetical protein
VSKPERQAFCVWQPATRLTAVVAHLGDDGTPQADRFAVLGVESQADDDGDVYHRVLILADGEVVTLKDARRLFFADDSLARVVETPWAAEEDGERLADVEGHLKRLLLRRKLAREWW